jgi:hypothetical protein
MTERRSGGYAREEINVAVRESARVRNEKGGKCGVICRQVGLILIRSTARGGDCVTSTLHRRSGSGLGFGTREEDAETREDKDSTCFLARLRNEMRVGRCCARTGCRVGFLGGLVSPCRADQPRPRWVGSAFCMPAAADLGNFRHKIFKSLAVIWVCVSWTILY